MDIKFALISLGIPIIFSIILITLVKHKIVWWEICLLFGASIIISLITQTLIINLLTTDTEYWGNIAFEARYYEDWNEYIHKTCSTTNCTGSGKNEKCTTTYEDCSYVQYHPKRFILKYADDKINISESEYNHLIIQWKCAPEFQNLHRSYHTNDGDLYIIK